MFENQQDKTNAWNQEHVFEHTMISLQCHNDESSCLNDCNDLLHVANVLCNVFRGANVGQSAILSHLAL